MPLRRHAQHLETLYHRLNRREYVHPDPMEVLYEYDDPIDREVAGLVASCLAYGRVVQILRSVRTVMNILGESPARYVRGGSAGKFERDFSAFKHRFADGVQLAALLTGLGKLLRRQGSVEASFVRVHKGDEESLVRALGELVDQLSPGGCCGHLLPDPAGGSACKRLHLYLRWMVRRDAVDVGHWKALGSEMLMVPLDTHMHRLGVALGATRRGAGNFRTAQEVTRAFRGVAPDDPVRYDFCLTRLGMNPQTGLDDFLAAIAPAMAHRGRRKGRRSKRRK